MGISTNSSRPGCEDHLLIDRFTLTPLEETVIFFSNLDVWEFPFRTRINADWEVK